MKLRFSEAAAWVVMLLVSNAPDVVLAGLSGHDTNWLFWFRLDLAGVVAFAGLVWPRLRSLRDFAIIMFAVLIARFIMQIGGGPGPWGSGSPNIFTSMMIFQLLRLGGAALVIGALLALGYRRRDLFLTRGAIDAPGRPIRWLMLLRSEPWTRFGPRIAALAGALLLVYLMFTARPGPVTSVWMLTAYPAVIPLAALNAFSEEMIFRAPLLATLEGPIGRRHALWISAAFYGIAHWSGVPWGWAGVLMATFFGWLMGRAMLETRGLFWAWVIHFVMDVVAFSFMAIGVRPGG